jgi:elongation factor Ts
MFPSLLTFVRSSGPVCRRCYSVASKPSIKLVAELRKLTNVSISKAREALEASSNDLNAAQQWLQNDMETSGAKRMAKLGGRTANEGLVAVALLSKGFGGSLERGTDNSRAAILELNCETDFVGRNDLFQELASDIAHTLAYSAEPKDSESLFQQCDLEQFLEHPLISSNAEKVLSPGSSATISSAIRDATVKLGEKIALRRAATFVHGPLPKDSGLGLRIAQYVHGLPGSGHAGRIGSLVSLSLRATSLHLLLKQQSFLPDLQLLERSMARQIVGLNPTSIHGPDDVPEEGSQILYKQPFVMHPQSDGQRSTGQFLRDWEAKHSDGEQNKVEVEVVDYLRWEVGDAL